MALRLEDKKVLVAEVKTVAESAHSAVAAEYRGLTVGQMTTLRREARNSGVYLRVVKNTLARLALEGTDFECMKDELKGPLVLAFSTEDPGAAARVIKAFAKANDKLVTRIVAIGGRFIPPPISTGSPTCRRWTRPGQCCSACSRRPLLSWFAPSTSPRRSLPACSPRGATSSRRPEAGLHINHRVTPYYRSTGNGCFA
jgi:ribosomal protein L10